MGRKNEVIEYDPGTHFIMPEGKEEWELHCSELGIKRSLFVYSKTQAIAQSQLLCNGKRFTLMRIYT